MSDDDEWRTVWVLGSGFSRPLGGPTLAQLLSLAAFDDFRIRYPDVYTANVGSMNAARYLYHFGTKFAQGQVGIGTSDGALLWEHAEEFLDRLDVASADEKGVAAQQLLEVMNSRSNERKKVRSVSDVRAAARRVVAAQCSAFAIESDINSERWRPFKDWVGALGPSDTVITFNYDPVLELLNENATLQFVLPGKTADQGRAAVYKLHGSVSWKREGSEIVPQDDLDFGARCKPDELAIATPGATKYAHVSTFFHNLWWKAEEALSKAHAVVFIGYRFPPSDAHSRERLLRALWRNATPQLHVYILLGPNVHHEDVVRLDQMLRWSIQSSGVERGPMLIIKAVPLFAQDYLTVWRLDPATRRERGEPPG